MSDSFGRRLRAERERRRISLSSISDNTKISITLLEGLERDDLTRWPTGIFRRSFFRSYAEAIGLDPEPLLREFLSRFPEPGSEGAAALASAPARSTDSGPELRLLLEETGLPFSGGRIIPGPRERWIAAAWDGGVLTALAVLLFVIFGQFWLPLGVSSLCYYVGGLVVLGNTPGVCLFARRSATARKEAPAAEAEPVTPVARFGRTASDTPAAPLEASDRLRLIRRA